MVVDFDIMAPTTPLSWFVLLYAVQLVNTERPNHPTFYKYSFADKPLGVSLRAAAENPLASVEVSAIKRQNTNIEVGDLVKAVNGQDVAKFKLQDIFVILKTVKMPIEVTFIRKKYLKK